MTERRFRVCLAVPFGILFLLLLFWQQGGLEVDKRCSNCGGTGRVSLDHIPEDPVEVLVDCDACGPLSRDRLERWARMFGKMLPDTPLGVWGSLAVIFGATLTWSFRAVRCRRCDGAGNSIYTACGGRGRHALLDRWGLTED
jgi:hypothetical protein